MSTHLQSGRTLIELLVAMALGIMILMGVGSLYLTANQTSRATVSIAQTEDQGNTLMYVIGSSIKRAGYSEIVGTAISANAAQAARDNLLYNGPIIRGCTNGRFANELDPAAANFACNANTGDQVGDTLGVWFQADTTLSAPQGPTTDCVGGNPPLVGGVPLVFNLYAAQRDAARPDRFNLRCRSGISNWQPVIDGILDFKVFYGFDETSYDNPASLADRPAARRVVDAAFLNALPGIGGLTAWDFVVSVHVCALMRTEEGGVSATAGGNIVPCPSDVNEAFDAPAPIANPAPGAVVRAYNQIFTVRSRGTPSPLRPV